MRRRASRSLTTAVVVSAVALLLSAPSSADGALSEGEFQELHRQLRPSDTEPWRTIPWKISLLDAQRSAVAEKKPIFIWAMDGHPLGCT